MTKVEGNSYGDLIYLKPKLQGRDLFDASLEFTLSRLVKIDTKDTEVNIPRKGKLVIGFMPHAGFMEAVVIDRVLAEIGRKPVVWVTKNQSRDLPNFINSFRRLIYVDRERPAPSTLRAIKDVLAIPDGTIGSAFEGTRFSNPNDSTDTRYLGEVKSGLMRFASESNVPILGVVVLGVDKILPSLDITAKEKGMGEALKLFAAGIMHPQKVDIRFLPLYTKHLDDDLVIKGKVRKHLLDWHNEQLIGMIIEEILKIDPQYPLGHYKER